MYAEHVKLYAFYTHLNAKCSTKYVTYALYVK